MFHWMLMAPQALKSVLPVEDSFSNKEMRTFSRISADISLLVKQTQVCEGEKQNQLVSTTSPLWFWQPRLVVHFRDESLIAVSRSGPLTGGGEVGIPAQPAKDCKGNPGSSRFSVFRGGTFLPQTGNWAIPPQLLPESEVSVLWSSLRTPYAPPCRKTYWIALACWASTLTKQRLFHLTISLTNLLRRRLERVWLHEDLGNYSNQLCCDLAAFTWATFAVYD